MNNEYLITTEDQIIEIINYINKLINDGIQRIIVELTFNQIVLIRKLIEKHNKHLINDINYISFKKLDDNIPLYNKSCMYYVIQIYNNDNCQIEF